MRRLIERGLRKRKKEEKSSPTFPFNLINMQILFRLHFFCNVGFYCSPLSLMDLRRSASTDFFIALAAFGFVFDFRSHFYSNKFFDSSLPICLADNARCSLFVLATFLWTFSISPILLFAIADFHHAQQREPFFDSNQNSNITVLENESVVLKCVVRNKGNKTVSQNHFSPLRYLQPHSFACLGTLLFIFHFSASSGGLK